MNEPTQKTIKKEPTIIVIEDDVFIKEIIITRLKKDGFNVLDAADGVSGLRLIESSSPDIVLLDLLIPILDGFELLARLNKSGLIKRIPVIVISNLAGEENIKRAKNLGAKEYIIKAQSTTTQIIERIKDSLKNKNEPDIAATVTG
ncbi:MAG: Response regulator receiver protein [Parcubacteria group bacterium GW2011_GWA2_42_14]|nr:MAG: Response regulator receiver protein [Parcubacteria group bacterium GW2011_GWA2_42_14]